jgi:hypothetical protein
MGLFCRTTGGLCRRIGVLSMQSERQGSLSITSPPTSIQARSSGKTSYRYILGTIRILSRIIETALGPFHELIVALTGSQPMPRRAVDARRHYQHSVDYRSFPEREAEDQLA